MLDKVYISELLLIPHHFAIIVSVDEIYASRVEMMTIFCGVVSVLFSSPLASRPRLKQ